MTIINNTTILDGEDVKEIVTEDEKDLAETEEETARDEQ